MKNSFAILLVAALLAGCASVPTNDAANQPPDLSRFLALSVAPIQFAPDIASALSDADRVSLGRDLRTALSEGLPPALRTDTQAPDAVRMEVKVTALDASSPTVNLLTTALLFVPMDAGGIAFDARFYAGDDAEPFARRSIRHTSTPLELRGSFSRYGHAEKVLRDFASELGDSFERAGPGPRRGR